MTANPYPSQLRWTRRSQEVLVAELMGSLLEHPCVTVKEATPSEVRYVLATLEADGGAMLSAGGRHPPYY